MFILLLSSFLLLIVAPSASQPSESFFAEATPAAPVSAPPAPPTVAKSTTGLEDLFGDVSFDAAPSSAPSAANGVPPSQVGGKKHLVYLWFIFSALFSSFMEVLAALGLTLLLTFYLESSLSLSICSYLDMLVLGLAGKC